MIETHELTKMYGELYALNRLNLTLQQGDVYGFIGPNGAGKTTTMRILATLLNPSWGEATVCGYSIYTGSKEIRRVIGYMPDFFGVYDDMKVVEYLEFFASAYRIKGARRKRSARSAGAGRPHLQAQCARNQPFPRHDSAPGPGPHPAARSPGPAAGRAGLGVRPSRPNRDARLAQRTAKHGQDNPGLQPHPPRARRYLQQDRRHRARLPTRQRRGHEVMKQVRTDIVLNITVSGA